MIAGRLCDRIHLYCPVRVANEYGEMETTWQDRGQMRAERVRLTGRGMEQAGEIFAEYAARWRVRYSHTVKSGWRVQQVGEDDGNLYEVRAVEPNRVRGLKELVCERVNE